MPDPPAVFCCFFRLEEDPGADEETQDHFARNQAENQCKTNRDAGKEPIATRHLTPARRSPTLKEKQPESRHDDLDDEDRLLPRNRFVEHDKGLEQPGIDEQRHDDECSPYRSSDCHDN